MAYDGNFDNTQCNLIYNFGMVALIHKDNKISFATVDCTSIYFSTSKHLPRFINIMKRNYINSL